jgi:hypothetical protein
MKGEAKVSSARGSANSKRVVLNHLANQLGVSVVSI